MGYYDEEFYDEQSEFEEHVIAMKEAIAKSIKEQFVAELDRLRTENAELQTVKRDWESIQREYANKHRELEKERRQIETMVRRERLSTLMKDFEVVMFTAEKERVEQPKCDKCDRYRKVKYTTPLGREAEEYRACSEVTYSYEPKEHVCSGFSTDSRTGKLDAWYKLKRNDDDYYERNSRFAKVVYQEGMSYEKLCTYDTFFKTREECQAYCDYLNSQGDAK